MSKIAAVDHFIEQVKVYLLSGSNIFFRNIYGPVSVQRIDRYSDENTTVYDDICGDIS